MTALDDLVDRIEDSGLRNSIKREISNTLKQKKFGLIFENHLPECTPLYDIPIKNGSLVAKKDVKIEDIYQVQKIEGDVAICRKKTVNGETETFPLNDLVSIAEFGNPIYPYLKPIDSVCNAPDGTLWHTLIESDNYHALQLLEYLYAGKVDCIYIDPPYNTGAKDWKYNNDYVDSSDTYRHSKWLSMLQRRLLIAKKLLNPASSVLIVTIDEKEYLHLGCLLEELFPSANIQMVTTIIKPEGTNRFNEFSRTNEFIFFVMIGDYKMCTGSSNMFETSSGNNDKISKIQWKNLRRRGQSAGRNTRRNQFYPVFINKETGYIDSIGDAISLDVDRNSVIPPEGCYALFPLDPNGNETIWSKHYSTAQDMLSKGYLRTTNGKDPKKAHVEYLPSGTVDDIIAGKVTITKYGEQGEIIGEYNNGEKQILPKTVWYVPQHNAQTSGSLLIKKILGENRFNFPKSVYAVRDCIRFFVGNNPDALIIDFFAGSGTTLHAVNMLNAEDGGRRRCIIVTNNEVSADEATMLKDQGYKPGDVEWEQLGIARYVTWPRTVCSIKGENLKGEQLSGSYYDTEMELSDGFHSNVIYFKLGFLDKNRIALGRQFKELLPILWMKSGCVGPCPSIDDGKIPKMMILPNNGFAILTDESKSSAFVEKITQDPTITTVFIVTDSDIGYKNIVSKLDVNLRTYQLYRDYLDNFSINRNR